VTSEGYLGAVDAREALRFGRVDEHREVRRAETREIKK
jgi:hypothetical protein